MNVAVIKSKEGHTVGTYLYPSGLLWFEAEGTIKKAMKESGFEKERSAMNGVKLRKLLEGRGFVCPGVVGVVHTKN